jgi:hypothetical protein
VNVGADVRRVEPSKDTCIHNAPFAQGDSVSPPSMTMGRTKDEPKIDSQDHLDMIGERGCFLRRTKKPTKNSRSNKINFGTSPRHINLCISTRTTR